MAPLTTALLFIGLAMIAVDETEPATGEADEAVAGALMFAVPCIILGLLLLRPVFSRRARVVVHPDRLELEYRPLLKSPLVIPRDYVKAIAIDSRPVRLGWFREHRRFHLGLGHGHDEGLAVEPDIPEWLWSRRGSPLPELSHALDVPNIALLFHRPLPPVRVRRFTRAFPSLTPVHSPRRRQPLRGLLLRVKEPNAAQETFTEWNLVRPLTIDDVLVLRPDPDERKRARRRRLKTVAGIVAIVLAQAIPPFFVE